MDEPHNVGHVAWLFTGLQSWPLFGIDQDIATLISFSEPPTLINIDVLIAGFLHSRGHEGFRLLHDYIRIHGIGKTVP